MKTVTHLVYTHSDYSNVFSLWYNQTKQYFPNSDIYLLSDTSFTEPVTTNVLYNDADKYTDRVLSCLSQFDGEEVVIFQHEDMPLYGTPLYETLEEFVKLVDTGVVDMIRLLRVVPQLERSEHHPLLYINPSSNLFSIQPTIIKIRTLREIYNLAANKTVWESELHWELHLRGHVSLFPYTGEPKRGFNHYDSKVYPYIATAITKGQWNVQEYPNELQRLFQENGL